MKRLIDFIISFIALILLSPVIGVVALLIRIKIGSPVLFKQPRPGLNGRVFYVYKFRTMTDARDTNGELLSDASRLTKLGKLLRKISLDELPQLWNVLKGEMSFVGPRPLLVEYLPLYNENQARRHNVRPGITGWAQVNGRNAISWEQKFEYDVWYVENQSLWLDFKILMLTMKKVFVSEGISQEGQATMEKFKGSERAINEIILIGDSGHAKVIRDCVESSGNKVVAMLDDKYHEQHMQHGVVKGPIECVYELLSEENRKVIISIGSNEIRKEMVERLALSEEVYASVIHKSAVVSNSIKIGVDSVIMPGVVINADAVVGDHCIINTGAVVEHDCIIDDFAHISPNCTLTGGVNVKQGVHLGASSSVIPYKSVGEWTVVGAGAVVVEDLPARCIAVGIPAKPIKKFDNYREKALL